MPLFKQPRSKYWWYSFYFQGKRYKGSTKETTKQAAGTVEAAAITRLMEGQPVTRKADKLPTLQVFSVRFLEWTENNRHLDPNTKKFYRYGWRLLSYSRLATLTLDQITPELVDCTQFMRPGLDRRTKDRLRRDFVFYDLYQSGHQNTEGDVWKGRRMGSDFQAAEDSHFEGFGPVTALTNRNKIT
jgi:hypothetical protein